MMIFFSAGRQNHVNVVWLTIIIIINVVITWQACHSPSSFSHSKIILFLFVGLMMLISITITKVAKIVGKNWKWKREQEKERNMRKNLLTWWWWSKKRRLPPGHTTTTIYLPLVIGKYFCSLKPNLIQFFFWN